VVMNSSSRPNKSSVASSGLRSIIGLASHEGHERPDEPRDAGEEKDSPCQADDGPEGDERWLPDAVPERSPRTQARRAYCHGQIDESGRNGKKKRAVESQVSSWPPLSIGKQVVENVNAHVPPFLQHVPHPQGHHASAESM